MFDHPSYPGGFIMFGISAVGDLLVGLYPVVDLLGASLGALL